jgi:NAD(P)-dependent dehydrogenase (short-subunit alcohol dehydrogenase family)
LLDFRNYTVLITGGTTGIGRGIADAFRSAGANVLVTGLTTTEVAAAREEGLDARQLNVADDQQIAGLVASLSSLDVLVNAAGMILRASAEFEIEGFLKVIDVNLSGTMRMCRACRPLLAKSGQGASIVNIASVLSQFGSGFVPGYSASKGGVAQLTKSLAIAWANEHIRVNAIAPGWIETALTQPLQDDPQRSATLMARTPLGRWGRPEDVAGAALFLSSSAAAFITGIILPVDGGYSIT